MKIGMTGTRAGMTTSQRDTFLTLLLELYSDTKADNGALTPGDFELHHGDCVGADEQAHSLAKQLGLRTVCHQPTSKVMRAFTSNDEVRDALPYQSRNKRIIAECDILLVVPRHYVPQQRGGTWYTYRHAMFAKKPIIVIYPDGSTRRFNGANHD